MKFGMPRSQMLKLLAATMEVPIERESALLGRFQHLQRLSLIDGINPGRGKGADYQAHQVVVIALAFQLIQLGLTPERAVHVIKNNQERIRIGISIALGAGGEIMPSLMWFDAAILTMTENLDIAELTFDVAGIGVAQEVFESFFVTGEVQRMAFVSLSNTLRAIVRCLDYGAPFPHDSEGNLEWKIKLFGRLFLNSLEDWLKVSTPDSLN